MRHSPALLAAIVAVTACSTTQDDGPTWMSALPDATSLAALSIPGTHDSGALIEPVPDIAKAQNLTIQEQLDIGVRYFDLRCRDVGDAFLIYHGAFDQEQTFDAVLATFTAFFATHPREAVIASVKEEDTEERVTKPFDAAFIAYVAMQPALWSTGDTVPQLGDARGKLVLLRRFDTTATAPLGIDATAWADNASFAITGSAATLVIEDNYEVGSGSAGNDAKWADITANLGSAATGDPATLFLTYTSGYQTMSAIPNIPAVSDDIDARLGTYFAAPGVGSARTGAVVMDFVTPDLAAAVIATNSSAP